MAFSREFCKRATGLDKPYYNFLGQRLQRGWFSFHGLSENQLEPPESSQDKVSDFWIREMDGPRSINHSLHSDGSENLVPRPGLVVTDFLMTALPVSSCLIISRDLRLQR